MSPELRKSPNLPNELWFHILSIAVENPDFPPHAFFPPKDDFNLIGGFKASCHRFRNLVEYLEHAGSRRSVYLRHPKDILEPRAPLEHIRFGLSALSPRPPTLFVICAEFALFTPCTRHLMIRDDAMRLPLKQCSLLARRLVSLESLSITCSDNAILTCLEKTAFGNRLLRLDLTCTGMYLSSLRLAFPNLLELRLSTFPPTTRTTRVEEFLLETMGFSLLNFDFDIMLHVFIEMLSESLEKLQSLRLLSMHVALVPDQQFNYARLYHADRHESQRCDFRVCKLCPDFSAMPDMVNREEAASTSLARILPQLERVRWTDPWKVEYFDEACQREYKIVRGVDSEVKAVLSHKATPDDMGKRSLVRKLGNV